MLVILTHLNMTDLALDQVSSIILPTRIHEKAKSTKISMIRDFGFPSRRGDEIGITERKIPHTQWPILERPFILRIKFTAKLSVKI